MVIAAAVKKASVNAIIYPSFQFLDPLLIDLNTILLGHPSSSLLNTFIDTRKQLSL